MKELKIDYRSRRNNQTSWSYSYSRVETETVEDGLETFWNSYTIKDDDVEIICVHKENFYAPNGKKFSQLLRLDHLSKSLLTNTGRCLYIG